MSLRAAQQCVRYADAASESWLQKMASGVAMVTANTVATATAVAVAVAAGDINVFLVQKVRDAQEAS